jgi:hypothetical protein
VLAALLEGWVSLGARTWNAEDAASINGKLANFANFLQDGTSTILPASYNNDNEIFETIAEVQVNSFSFSGEYGMGGVVFNQISECGINTWRGSAYEYLQNSGVNTPGYGLRQRTEGLWARFWEDKSRTNGLLNVEGSN